MDCSAIAGHLSPLADGELEQETAERVRAHLHECPHCNRLLQDHLTIKQLLPQKLPFEKASPGLKSAILDGLNASPVSDFFHVLFARFRAQPFLASGVAVTAFLAVFASVLLWMNRHGLPPLVREVIAHHAEASQHPLEIVTADASELARQIGLRWRRNIGVPDLSSKDCTLMGASRCPVSGRSAVEMRYGHPKAKVTLFVISGARKEDFTGLCKPGTLRKKRIGGKTYYYCETKSCRAIVWWEDDYIIVMTSCLPLPEPFETAREIRRACHSQGT